MDQMKPATSESITCFDRQPQWYANSLGPIDTLLRHAFRLARSNQQCNAPDAISEEMLRNASLTANIVLKPSRHSFS